MGNRVLVPKFRVKDRAEGHQKMACKMVDVQFKSRRQKCFTNKVDITTLRKKRKYE